MDFRSFIDCKRGIFGIFGDISESPEMLALPITIDGKTYTYTTPKDTATYGTLAWHDDEGTATVEPVSLGTTNPNLLVFAELLGLPVAANT